MHKNQRKRSHNKQQKKNSDKKMMEQLSENSLPCLNTKRFFWRYKFQPCRQPQFLPASPWLKMACSLCGSAGNTFAHTCALFISNRCRVEGPVQNGCHLSSINNSVPRTQTWRGVTHRKHTHFHAGLQEVVFTSGWMLSPELLFSSPVLLSLIFLFFQIPL